MKFLTDDLRVYVQNVLKEDSEFWHLKIAQTIEDKYSFILTNSTYLAVLHFSKAHRLLNTQKLELHIRKTIEQGLILFNREEYFS